MSITERQVELSSERYENGSEQRPNSYYNANLLMCVLLGIGVALVLYQHLPNTDGEQYIASEESVLNECFEFFYSIAVFTLYFWMVRNKNKFDQLGLVCWSCDAPRENENDVQLLDPEYDQSSEHRKHSLWPALVILGAGAVFKYLIKSLTGLWCILFYRVSVARILETVNSTAYFCVVVIQIRFFHIYNGAIFRSLDMFNYVLSAGIVLNAWSWIILTTVPLEKIATFNDTHTCPETASLLSIFHDNVVSYIEPFVVEFTTVATTILFHYWDVMSSINYRRRYDINARCVQNNNLTEAIESESQADDSTEFQMLLFPPNSNRTSDQLLSRQAQRCASYGTIRPIRASTTTSVIAYVKNHMLLTSYSLLTVLVYIITLLILYDYFGNPDDHDTIVLRECLFWAIDSAFFLPMSCWFVRCLYKIRSCRRMTRRLTSNDYLLLFAALWDITLNMLRLLESIGMITSTKKQEYHDFAIIMAFWSVLTIAEVTIQTKFIVTISHSSRKDTGSREGIRLGLLHCMIINAAQWFVISVAHGTIALGHSPPMFGLMEFLWLGEEAGKFVILILYPMISLFRFHSSLLAYDLLKSH